MQIVLADDRLLWRVINYLQLDASKKGILKHGSFLSFWYNLDEFTPAMRQGRLHVVLDSGNRLLAYFITGHHLENDGSAGTTDKGDFPIDIFEVIPKYRNKGMGSFIVTWIEGKARTAGFNSLRVLPANKSETFWKKKGFDAWGEKHGYLRLPIA